MDPLPPPNPFPIPLHRGFSWLDSLVWMGSGGDISFSSKIQSQDLNSICSSYEVDFPKIRISEFKQYDKVKK